MDKELGWEKVNDKERGGPVRVEGVSGRVPLGVLSGDPVGEIGVGDSTRFMLCSIEDCVSTFPVSSSSLPCPDEFAELSFASRAWLVLTDFTDGIAKSSQYAEGDEFFEQSEIATPPVAQSRTV